METTDIWFAAVLKIKGFQLKDCKKFERGRGSFVFDITPEQWRQEKIHFLNSDICKVKQEAIALKDLLF